MECFQSVRIGTQKFEICTTDMGISSIHISDRQVNATSVESAVVAGQYQIIFVSPETLFHGVLCTYIYQQNLMAFVIDDVKKW